MNMKVRRPVTWLWAAVFCLTLTSAASAEDLVIIGNPNLPAPSLDAKDLQRIYMGKQTRWDNDVAIVPVMLKSGAVHDSFVESYLGRSVHRFVTYWRQMVFTGKGMPPRSFASENELVEFVANTPGSLGYASARANVQSVMVILIAGD